MMKTTKDYTIFRHIPGNRNISSSHVDKLVEAIKRKNLLPYFPILCNDKMQVIDGQHKLKAAQRLKYDVTYAVVPGLKLEDVISINTNSKGWSVHDFIDTWIALKREDYIVLKDFMTKYDLSPGMAAALLYGFTTSAGTASTILIRSGNFKVNAFDFACLVADQLNDLRRYGEFKIRSDRQFVRTLVMLNNNMTFDFDRLLAKMQLSNMKLSKRFTVPQYLLQIEELYNFNAKQKVELYASSQMK